MPVRSNKIIEKYSEDNNKDKMLVKLLSSFYWDEVRNLITNSTVTNVRIDNFGTFCIKPWVLPKILEALQKSMTSDSKSEYTKSIAEKEFKRLTLIHNKILEEKEHLITKKNLKNELNKNMKKQK